MDTDKKEKLLKNYFAGREDVLMAFIFGSRAKKRASGVSDLDCKFTCGSAGQPAPNSGLAYGGFCDGFEQTGLTGDTPYTYLDPAAACILLTRCEVKCNPTFIATGGTPSLRLS